MKGIFYILLIVVVGCAAPRNKIKTKTVNISKLVFKHYSSISEEGEKKLLAFQDSLYSQILMENNLDSIPKEFLNDFSLIQTLKSSSEAEIHIEINGDTIWRYKTIKGEIIGDLLRIDRNDGTFYNHAKIDKSIMYGQFNLLEMDNDYTIEELPNDKKKFLGYPCYKVIIRKKDDDDFLMKTGDTIYEMYVTKQVNLPIYALLNLRKDSLTFFPLQIKEWKENLKGYQDVYEIKEIR